MKSLLLLAVTLLASPAFAEDVAIVNVTVVDTQAGALAAHRTVVLHDGRIASVAAGPAPTGAKIVDGRGRYLVPGLWDMVTHLSWTHASAMPVLIANGVTAVRDEGGDLAQLAIWAEAVRSGRILGPTIFQVGPMLNGKSFNRYQYAIGSGEQAATVVRLLKFEGVDGLEIERRLPREAYLALMAQAKASGLQVGGKVPIEVTPLEATDAGQATIDNLETIYDGLFHAAHESDVAGGIDDFLAPGHDGDALIAALLRNQTAITPCIATFSDALASADVDAHQPPEYRYVARSERLQPHPVAAAELAEFRKMIPRLQRTIAKFATAGVTILAGSDIAADRIPGFSLQNEFIALALAGLSPLQVLQSATINPAKVMGRTADYGTVAVGKVADLVLLSADPTKSVLALRRIDAVVLHGRILDRAALDDQLRLAAAMAEAD